MKIVGGIIVEAFFFLLDILIKNMFLSRLLWRMRNEGVKSTCGRGQPALDEAGHSLIVYSTSLWLCFSGVGQTWPRLEVVEPVTFGHQGNTSYWRGRWVTILRCGHITEVKASNLSVVLPIHHPAGT